jgi:DNA polymerase III epsilon subunit family exonuclease
MTPTSLDSPLHLVNFVSVDVETTGLDPRRDAIIEIGAVRVRGGAIVDEFETLVACDRAIPHDAWRVHRISADMLVGRPPPARAIRMLLSFIGDGVPVEHSWKAFDVAFLENALGQPLAPVCINTCTLSRRLFPFHRKHSLEECCRRHSITNQQAHRALSDARATAQLLLYFLTLCSTRYPRLKDLAKVASVER